jgi:prepilin-type N-terminal cleavage/methylation domain-containing protein
MITVNTTKFCLLFLLFDYNLEKSINNFYKNMNKKKGFTLIEVLTVIMIIAILASIVLVSLETARNRTKDVTIQNQLGQLRSLAEALYTLEDGYEDFTVNDHTENPKFLLVKEKIEDMGGSMTPDTNIRFSTDNQQYCAFSPLVRESGSVFCVDSTGNADIISEGEEHGCTGDTFVCKTEGEGSGGVEVGLGGDCSGENWCASGYECCANGFCDEAGFCD